MGFNTGNCMILSPYFGRKKHWACPGNHYKAFKSANFMISDDADELNGNNFDPGASNEICALSKTII